jgi:hypothetical protein
MSKPPNPRPAGGKPSTAKAPARAGAAPRKAPPRRPPGGKGRIRQGLATRAWGGGPSWLGVVIIVLTVLVILPIAAAVLGDIWAVILGALVGGFALGRSTAR